MANIRAKFDKMDEADIPSSAGIDNKGAGLGAGRSPTTLEGKEPQVEVIDNAFNRENYKELIGKKYAKSKAPSYARVKEVTEGKKGVNPFAKKDGKASTKTPAKGKKPDFLDLDKDGDKKEPMKKAAADKKKQKVKESMNHRISAARLEGKSHGLRGHAHSGKRYEDLDEMKAYHDGYKDGLDECYGQGVYEGLAGTAGGAIAGGMLGGPLGAVAGGMLGSEMSKESAPAMPAATVGGMANQELDEISSELASRTLGKRQQRISRNMPAGGPKDFAASLKRDSALMARAGLINHPGHRGPNDSYPNFKPAMEDEMDEGNAFTAALAKTPKGGKFSVGGKTFTDRTGYDAKVNEYAFESLDKQLNALLNESEEVSEGLSVSISKGQENSPDSVTITAQDAEADQLLAIVKQAGLGLFGGDDPEAHSSSAMSIQPVGAGEPEANIDVVDGSDGMLSLMKKLGGISDSGQGDEDYADEEGDEEQLYGNHQAADKKDCGDYDQPSNEDTCNECGGMMEAGHGCSSEMVDEVESEDQQEFEVAEANAPDTGADNTNADVAGQIGADKALAIADAGQDEEDGMSDQAVQESDDEEDDEYYDKDGKVDPNGAYDAAGHYDRERDMDEEKVSESSAFANLFRKLSFIAEESTDKEDEKAEKAGKKVAKDIEYDEDHKGKDDDKAEKAGKKVTKDIEYDDKKDKKEKVDEWANNAGPGKTVSDTTFEQDIDFMTKVISGGLNKQKSTGQTTIPVIAGQDTRTHNNPQDWATLAGIKKS